MYPRLWLYEYAGNVFDYMNSFLRGGLLVKLDIFYEFQPKRKPWALPHPYGQRDAEQQTYREAIAQIQYADKLGFETVWIVEHHFREERSVAATPEAILGGLALSTERIRLGFGVVLMPFGFTHPVRVAEKVATVDILSRWPGGVGHWPVDADGAGGIRRAGGSGGSRAVARGGRGRRCHVGERVAVVGQP